jgi:hypothetical protein
MNGFRRMALIGLVAVTAAFTATVGTAQAAVVFDGGPGTGPPPPTLGPYTMTPFPPDPQPLFTSVGSVASPLGGSLTFTPEVQHVRIGDGWSTWSNGYTGDVYWTFGATSLTLGLPTGTTAFYFYAEPNPFGVFTITATAQDGTTSGPISVDGSGGARYFGFYVTGGSALASITVSSPVDFAVGEFGIASGPTSAAQCKKGGWRSFGVFKNQGDCVSFVVTNGRNGPSGP